MSSECYLGSVLVTGSVSVVFACLVLFRHVVQLRSGHYGVSDWHVDVMRGHRVQASSKRPVVGEVF